MSYESITIAGVDFEIEMLAPMPDGMPCICVKLAQENPALVDARSRKIAPIVYQWLDRDIKLFNQGLEHIGLAHSHLIRLKTQSTMTEAPEEETWRDTSHEAMYITGATPVDLQKSREDP